MTTDHIEVRRVATEDEFAAALELRRVVFCEEQGVTFDAEQDGRDREAFQLVALDNDRVIGTLRLLFDSDAARLGRMVVDARERGKGVAARLLAAADAEAVAAGAERIVLSAQLTARSVYARAGYEPHGEVYLDEEIEHVRMEKVLG